GPPRSTSRPGLSPWGSRSPCLEPNRRRQALEWPPQAPGRPSPAPERQFREPEPFTAAPCCSMAPVGKENADQPIGGVAVTDAAKERAGALVGRTLIGRYRIDRLVAMGGIASVFRAERISDRQEVAIKVLHPMAEGLPELIERFEREAIAGKHIFHP